MNAPQTARRQQRGWLWMSILVVVVVAVAIPLAVIGDRNKTVVCFGDSLTAESDGAIAGFLDFQGYTVQNSAIAGSGLLDTNIDWLNIGHQMIAKYDPSVVTVEFIGDYGFAGTPPGVAAYSPTFYTDWAAKAQQLEDILTSRGAKVYWVIGPPVANPTIQTVITNLDRIYEGLHAPNTASGRPPLIDVTPALTGNKGVYTEYLPGKGGIPVEVRTPDGTHFTLYGIALFGRAVAEAIA